MPLINHYGWAESTAAMRGILARGLNGVRRTKRASGKRKKSAASPKARKAKRARAKKAHLVKGSAAAKKYMAKLRKKAAKARRG